MYLLFVFSLRVVFLLYGQFIPNRILHKDKENWRQVRRNKKSCFEAIIKQGFVSEKEELARR